MKYLWRDNIYNTEREVDDAIEERFASDYNNCEVPSEVYEYEWKYEVEEI